MLEVRRRHKSTEGRVALLILTARNACQLSCASAIASKIQLVAVQRQLERQGWSCSYSGSDPDGKRISAKAD